MNDLSKSIVERSPEQQAIQAKCFHPNGTFIEFKKEEIEQSIVDRFEETVAKYPDRVAVKTNKRTLTYNALNQAANQVARTILSQRGERKEPIALLFEQSASLITAIIGALKAGKVYVPLDPYYPQARLAFMLGDSQAKLILTNNKNLSLAHQLSPDERQLINIADLDSTLASENLGLSISPDSLAWIIYTSGSTGQPKGVMQTHRNVLHEIMNYTNQAHICQDDRLVLLSSPSFGDAVRTTYVTLLNGASLYPIDIKTEGLNRVANFLIQERITVYRSVPTVFRYFASPLSGEGAFPELRLIYLAGDTVSGIEVALYKKHFSQNCIFINGLGTTECLTFRWYFLDKDTQVTSNGVPVGYQVRDKQVLLLDDTGEKVGADGIGEIAVKSCYLSPGYWQKPDFTHAAFIPDREGSRERIFRTGDIGRMRLDNCLEHLGRKDFQVKVRGLRIEVAEIEMALVAIDTIKEAVVVGREDGSHETRLVAYIVPANNPAPTASALRRALSEKLPDYMIPSRFVFLDALPLTPNGKVNRKGLPDPVNSRPELDTAFVLPRTPFEEKLARIWAEVLSLDQVGIHDKFLDLGGHSLAATRVISRVIEGFQLELPLKSLFEAPTVAAMAALITENQAKNAAQEALARMLLEVEALSDKKARELIGEEAREIPKNTSAIEAKSRK